MSTESSDIEPELADPTPDDPPGGPAAAPGGPANGTAGFDPSSDKLYTPKEAAELFNVKQDTVRNWMQSGKLPYIRLETGRYRIKRSDLLAFANRRFG